MHANKLELVSSQAVGPSALRWQREKSLYGGHGGWLRSHEGNDSAYEPSVSADCCRNRRTVHFLPAAGNRWNGELNNAGSNGNYWSSTLNESNPNNAWNLNFNSGNVNTNNNNRNNGQSVRPVRQHLPHSLYNR